MSTWINGRPGTKIDARDRGLQYGDGVFETMRVSGGRIRLLDFHLDRLGNGCGRLQIAAPPRRMLRRELERIGAGRDEGALKLIVTRGSGRRGYRPTGDERCTRIVSLHRLPKALRSDALIPARVRLCTTRLSVSPHLAGLKTLNRLDSVLARSEWQDARIWEGLMRDADENIVCGTMSNLFLRRGSALMTPVLDRCGVAGVMRRWILETAGSVGLTPIERRIRWRDLAAAEEVFMSNALIGLRSVAAIGYGRRRVRYPAFDAALRLRQRLDDL